MISEAALLTTFSVSATASEIIKVAFYSYCFFFLKKFYMNLPKYLSVLMS